MLNSKNSLEITKTLLTIFVAVGSALGTAIHWYIAPLEKEVTGIEKRLGKIDDAIVSLNKVTASVSPIDLQQSTEIDNIKQNVAVLQDSHIRSIQRIDNFANEIKVNDISKVDKTEFNRQYDYLLRKLDSLYCPCHGKNTQ